MPSQTQIKTAYAMFAVSTFLFVVLLGARILPSSSPGWAAILMWTQVLLVLLVQAQDSTFKPECNVPPLLNISVVGNTAEAIEKREACPRNFWWMVVLSVFGLFWLVLFWALPLLSEYQATGFRYDGAVVKRMPQRFKIKRRSVVTCVPLRCKNQRRKKKKAVAGQAA